MADSTDPLQRKVTLGYAGTDLSGAGASLVTVARCGRPEEASMKVGYLEAAGIAAVTVNDNMSSMGLYSGMLSTEVQVRQSEAEQARLVLRLAESDEVEPAEGSPPASQPTDADGRPVELVVVGRYSQIRRLREQAVSLEAARVQAFLPKLVERPAGFVGDGDRFLLRVRRLDLERAEAVLIEVGDEREEGEQRCPKCGSWRCYPVSRFKETVLSFFGLGPKPAAEMDCLLCKYRGPRSEFD